MKVEDETAVADVAASRPATSPAAGPPIDLPSHQVTPTAAIPKIAIRKSDRGRVRASRGNGGRGKEVVVERAVMDVADRGRRSQERHDAVGHERLERGHVRPLVRVPGPTAGEPRQAERRSDDQQAGQDGQVAPPGRYAHQAGSAARARVPRRLSASGGSGAGRTPAARLRARAMFTAS